MVQQLPVLVVPKTRSPRSVAASALAGLLGFVLVAAWGVHRTPWPEDFPVSLKLEYLEENAEQFDALFVGSSNVFRSFVPAVIDARLEELGTPLHTFNLGGPGMYSFETDYVLRRALDVFERRGVRLRYVFIEPGNWEAESVTEPSMANMLSDRSVFFHDARETWSALCSLVRHDEPVRQRAKLALSHLHAFARKLTSYGQGRRILDDLLGRPQVQPITWQRLEAGHGYQALEEIPGWVSRRRRELLLVDIPGYRAKVQRTTLRNEAPLDPAAYCRTAIARQQAVVRAAGAEPVYVLAPATLPMHHALRLRDEGAIRLIAFNDPERFPAFYEPERRFDPNHLDRLGAARFSRLFATELSRFLRSGL